MIPESTPIGCKSITPLALHIPCFASALPVEIWFNILGRLPTEHLPYLNRTCTLFYHIAEDLQKKHIKTGVSGFGIQNKIDVIISKRTNKTDFNKELICMLNTVSERTLARSFRLDLHPLEPGYTTHSAGITNETLLEISKKIKSLTNFTMVARLPTPENKLMQDCRPYLLDDETLVHLTTSHPKIESLTLEGCPKITEAIMAHILTKLTRLTHFQFKSKQITTLLLDTLKNCRNLQTLTLKCEDNPVTPEAIKSLKEALPHTLVLIE